MRNDEICFWLMLVSQKDEDTCNIENWIDAHRKIVVIDCSDRRRGATRLVILEAAFLGRFGVHLNRNRTEQV